MESIKKISSWHMICLIVVSRIMHEYSYLPILLTVPRTQDTWLQAIGSILYTVLFSLPILILINKFKNKETLTIFSKIWGKLGSKIITFIMVLFLLFCGTACLSLAISFISSHLFYKTPFYITTLFILVPSLYISSKGLVTVSKLASLVFIMIVSTIIFFFLLGLPQMDFSKLLPIAQDTSLWTLNYGAIIEASKFSDVIILFFLYFHLDNVKNINKSYIISLLITIGLLLLILIPVITVLGVDLATKTWNPYYLFTRQVEVYDFIQRVEVFNLICWLSGSIIKVATYIYLASYYLKKIFKFPKQSVFNIGIGVFIFGLIFILRLDRTYIIEIIRSDSVFPFVVSFFITLIPLITLIVYWFRRKQIVISENMNNGVL